MTGAGWSWGAGEGPSGAETFVGRYDCDRLICVEPYPSVRDAIARETQLKGWRRAKKVALINRANPGWHDLRGRG